MKCSIVHLLVKPSVDIGGLTLFFRHNKCRGLPHMDLQYFIPGEFEGVEGFGDCR